MRHVPRASVQLRLAEPPEVGSKNNDGGKGVSKNKPELTLLKSFRASEATGREKREKRRERREKRPEFNSQYLYLLAGSQLPGILFRGIPCPLLAS